jgi:tripartite-type tricarboxylate transporter receptor subunit TctC
VPAGTPADVVAKINATFRRILGAPDMLALAETQGIEVTSSTPEEALRILRADTERWAKLVKERNIRIEP